MTQEEFEVFRTNYLVWGLGEEVIQRLADLAEIKQAPAGRKLIVQEELGTDLYVILSGKVEIWCNREAIDEKGPGAVVGEVALLDNGPRSADVVTSTPVTYAEFDGTTLRRFMAGNCEAGFLILVNLSRVLTMALREATKQIEDLRGEKRDLAQPAG